MSEARRLDLSPRATAWLTERHLRRALAPLDRAATRALLIGANLPVWEPLVAAELRFGGLVAVETDTRELHLGLRSPLVPEAKPASITFRGQRLVEIASFDAIRWLMDEEGRVTELDELNHTFYVADSPAKRLEQLAFEAARPGDDVERLDGFHGARLAAEHGLACTYRFKAAPFA